MITIIGTTFFTQTAESVSATVMVEIPVGAQPTDTMVVSWWGQYAEAVDPRLIGVSYFFRPPNHVGAYGLVGNGSDVELLFTDLGAGFGEFPIVGALVVVRGGDVVAAVGGGAGDFGVNLYNDGGDAAVVIACTHDGSANNYITITGTDWVHEGTIHAVPPSGEAVDAYALIAATNVVAPVSNLDILATGASGGVLWDCSFRFAATPMSSEVQPPNMRVGFL